MEEAFKPIESTLVDARIGDTIIDRLDTFCRWTVIGRFNTRLGPATLLASESDVTHYARYTSLNRLQDALERNWGARRQLRVSV